MASKRPLIVSKICSNGKSEDDTWKKTQCGEAHFLPRQGGEIVLKKKIPVMNGLIYLQLVPMKLAARMGPSPPSSVTPTVSPTCQANFHSYYGRLFKSKNTLSSLRIAILPSLHNDGGAPSTWGT